MPKKFDPKVKEKVLQLHKAGKSAKEIAAVVPDIAEATVRRWTQSETPPIAGNPAVDNILRAAGVDSGATPTAPLWTPEKREDFAEFAASMVETISAEVSKFYAARLKVQLKPEDIAFNSIEKTVLKFSAKNGAEWLSEKATTDPKIAGWAFVGSALVFIFYRCAAIKKMAAKTEKPIDNAPGNANMN